MPISQTVREWSFDEFTIEAGRLKKGVVYDLYYTINADSDTQESGYLRCFWTGAATESMRFTFQNVENGVLTYLFDHEIEKFDPI